MNTPPEPAAALDAIIVGDFAGRVSRPADHAAEDEVLLWLADEMAKAPSAIFTRLVEAVLVLCPAHSAGISVLDEAKREFVWPAVAGQWSAHVGGRAPRDFGPCGTVMDRDEALVFARPERHFTYLRDATPRIEEGLLVPFRIDGRFAGTIWAISHDAGTRFQPEDARLLEGLSKFTAAAYQTLSRTGVLEPSPAMPGASPA